MSPVATSSLSYLGLLLLVFKTLTSSSHLPHSLPLCPSFSYFAGKGLAETSRLMFFATNTPFSDVRYPMDVKTFSRPEFDAAKASGAFPMDQVPVLVVKKAGKEYRLCQSKAVARYVAGATGLAGSSAEEAADIDSVCETVVDLSNASSQAKDEDAKKKFLEETLPKALAYFEKLLGAGFSVGGKLSQADIVLYNFATHYFSPSAFNNGGNPAAAALVSASPKVASIVATVKALPGIASWEAGRAARAEPF